MVNAKTTVRATAIVLVSRGAQVVDTSVVNIESIARPRWVEQLPHNGEYVYGRGVERYDYPFGQSWWQSEENAILALARQYQVKLSQLWLFEAFTSDSLYSLVRQEVFDVELRGVEVVARWLDVPNATCFTLVRMRKLP